MKPHFDDWAQGSAAERFEHCVSRSLMAQNRADHAPGELKPAYVEMAVGWLILADAVQRNDPLVVVTLLLT